MRWPAKIKTSVTRMKEKEKRHNLIRRDLREKKNEVTFCDMCPGDCSPVLILCWILCVGFTVVDNDSQTKNLEFIHWGIHNEFRILSKGFMYSKKGGQRFYFFLMCLSHSHFWRNVKISIAQLLSPPCLLRPQPAIFIFLSPTFSPPHQVSDRERKQEQG